MIDDVKIICGTLAQAIWRDRYGACLAQILEALGQSNEWSEVASGLEPSRSFVKGQRTRFG